jgi:hypothetical protein
MENSNVNAKYKSACQIQFVSVEILFDFDESDFGVIRWGGFLTLFLIKSPEIEIEI